MSPLQRSTGMIAVFVFVGIIAAVVGGVLVLSARSVNASIDAVDLQYCGSNRPQCGLGNAKCLIVGKYLCASDASPARCPDGYKEACAESDPPHCDRGSKARCVCVGFWGCT